VTGVPEARLKETEHGLVPESDGWFVVNARDARWTRYERRGQSTSFDADPELEFPDLGVRLEVLLPEQPSGLYHAEAGQEDFLVLSGECILVIEGEERRLKPWDFVHCPPWTEHIFVGAGDGPCAIFMVGVRSGEWRVTYPRSELAARFGASAAADTSDPDEAYVGFEPSRRERPSYWDRLPWG
jgi:uncharacterized cupin superfamily protein